ncbi:MAG: HD domain-containing protein [Alphaproteobacteria bacterium]|nr:HD domain-containing protein [Alphaproteobacteria bacterium]
MADDEHAPDTMHEPLGRAEFKSFAESTQEDWLKIAAANEIFKQSHVDRILTHLKLLEGDCGGFPVSRLEHSLQTATMAHKAGKDEEYVVCALLHDIGDTLGVYNHPDIAAAIVKPFVSEANHWMVEKHGIFQGYYFFHHLGLDRNVRDQFRGHPHFEHCAQFCHLFDQPAFDKDYKSMPLSEFEPMLRRVMAAPKQSIYLRKDGDAAW